MIVKGALNKEFGFSEYSKYILNSPAILIEDDNGNSVYTKDKKIKDIYNDRELSKKDIEHIISMFFPDVRLKNYVEIRMADCLPIDYALSYASIIKGIFYSEEVVKLLLDKFEDIKDIDVIKAKEEVVNKGYDAKVYGFDIKDLMLNLIELAKDHLCHEEKDRASLFYDLIKMEKTLKILKDERGE